MNYLPTEGRPRFVPLLVLIRSAPALRRLERARFERLCMERFITQDATERARTKARRRTYLDLCRRDGPRCNWCRAEHSLTVDHIVPKSKGGSNHPTNLQVLCLRCNQAKAWRPHPPKRLRHSPSTPPLPTWRALASL